MYFASYEYVHDFCIKHPYIALSGAITMFAAGCVKPTA